MRTFPKWATPQRRGWLALKLATTIAQDTGGFEVDLLTGRISHPEYDKLQNMLRHEWAAEDREERAYLLKLEQERFHPKDRIHQGRFDSIARDIFLSAQPSHYVMGQTLDVLRQQPVALVRVASSPVQLWVDIPQKPSKHALRKARWLRKQQSVIEQAVSDYHNS